MCTGWEGLGHMLSDRRRHRCLWEGWKNRTTRWSRACLCVAPVVLEAAMLIVRPGGLIDEGTTVPVVEKGHLNCIMHDDFALSILSWNLDDGLHQNFPTQGCPGLVSHGQPAI